MEGYIASLGRVKNKNSNKDLKDIKEDNWGNDSLLEGPATAKVLR